MFKQKYIEQVRLLVSVLPYVADEKCFALKGGTAINLFVRDMPRLSVDIDLTYLPLEPRDVALKQIDAALRRISARVAVDLKANIRWSGDQPADKFDVEKAGSTIKIEVNPVIRGCLFEPEQKSVQPAIQETFGFAEMQVVSFQDLYAGKICAALDRQHPRDWYDVKLLLDNEGMDRRLMQALLVYIASSGRPMNEVLTSRSKDIRLLYENHFDGMTRYPVPLEDLLQIRERLLNEIARHFTQRDGDFLLSLKNKAPNWDLLGIEGVQNLAAVQWKLHNINQMSPALHAKELEKLENAVDLLHKRRMDLERS